MSTKGFQQNPKDIIFLACPNGHYPFIYKEGIKVGKMFDNHLLRLPESQRIIPPEYEDKVKVLPDGMTIFVSMSDEEIQQYTGKKLYKLTPAQMGIMGKKCFECEK